MTAILPRIVLLLVLALAGFGAALPARAQPMRPGTRVALVVGNSAYGRPANAFSTAGSKGMGEWPALTNPANDADAVGAALRAAGFEVVLLKDATRDKLAATIAQFSQAASGADTALFYYAGHGFEYAGTSYIVPVDAPLMTSPKAVGGQFVDLAGVYTAEGRARHGLVFLDACRTRDPVVQIEDADMTAGPADQVNLPDSFDGVVFFSTARNRPAYDATPWGVGQNSPFARAVVDWLATPTINLTDYFNFVRTQVVRSTSGAEYAYGVQKPIPYGQLPDQNSFFLEPPGPGTAGRAGDPDKARRAIASLTDQAIRTDDGQALIATVLRSASAADVRAAADRGEIMAQYLYGMMAYLGIGERADRAKARTYLERGAMAGLPIAQTAYGYLLEYSGDGGADKALAMKMYEAASAQGFAKATSNLAHMLWFEPAPLQDRKRALDLWGQAAAAGYPYAIFATGMFGDRHDAAAAALRAAAQQGSPSAGTWLCELEAGLEPWQHPESVFRECVAAAQDNHPEAMAVTAWLYRTGRGTPLSLKDAKYWATLARSHLTPAMSDLARYLQLYDSIK